MKARASIELVSSHGRLTPEGTRMRAALARTRRRAVHDEQIVSGYEHSAELCGFYDCGPMVLRDPFTGAPLLYGPALLPNRSSQVRGGTGRGVTPKSKNIVEGSHGAVMTRDNLSRQAVTSYPLTADQPKRTICPMGTRVVTPKAFKESFCKRLRAARMLKYEQASDFAHDLGIPANTYGKYESGRSLLPHHLVPLACELLEIEPKTLFAPEYKAARKTGTG